MAGQFANMTIPEHGGCATANREGSLVAISVKGEKWGSSSRPLPCGKGREIWHSVNIRSRVRVALGNSHSLRNSSGDSILQSGNTKSMMMNGSAK